MIDFLEVWKKEVWKKRIFAVLFLISLLAFLICLGYNLQVEKKTKSDKVYMYVVCRLNYLPTKKDLERAYFKCPYQAKFIGYEALMREEIETVRKMKLVSFFLPKKREIMFFSNGSIVVPGRRTTGVLEKDRIKNVKTERVFVCLKIYRKGLILEKVAEAREDPKKACSIPEDAKQINLL